MNSLAADNLDMYVNKMICLTKGENIERKGKVVVNFPAFQPFLQGFQEVYFQESIKLSTVWEKVCEYETIVIKI